jgi:3-oxoacyl-[acyl-carrier protein] reductase
MSKLTGKVAIVTGASKGIGARVALELAEAGAAVVVNYASSKEGADRVVSDITANGGKAIAVQGNVSKAADVARLFAETQQAFGTPNILVNNAGIYQFLPLEGVTEEEFHRQFNTNVLGSILAAQQAVKSFGNDGGSIINISSVVSESPVAGSVVYASTKGAMDAMTRTLAVELGARNIRVNTVAPGMVETEGVHAAGFLETDFHKEVVAKTPLGRHGQPDDISKVVLFLASDDSRWVTGERISVSGGFR